MLREPFLEIKAQKKPWMKLINTEVSTERKDNDDNDYKL